MLRNPFDFSKLNLDKWNFLKEITASLSSFAVGVLSLQQHRYSGMGKVVPGEADMEFKDLRFFFREAHWFALSRCNSISVITAGCVML